MPKLKELLEAAKFQVETFATAELILSHIKKTPPHIIFSGADLDVVDSRS